MATFTCPNCDEGSISFNVSISVQIDAKTQNIDPDLGSVDAESADENQWAHCSSCEADFLLSEAIDKVRS